MQCGEKGLIKFLYYRKGMSKLYGTYDNIFYIYPMDTIILKADYIRSQGGKLRSRDSEVVLE